MLGRNTLEIFCAKTRSKKLFKFIVANLEGAVPICGAKFPAISPFFCFVHILITCALYFFYKLVNAKKDIRFYHYFVPLRFFLSTG